MPIQQIKLIPLKKEIWRSYEQINFRTFLRAAHIFALRVFFIQFQSNYANAQETQLGGNIKPSQSWFCEILGISNFRRPNLKNLAHWVFLTAQLPTRNQNFQNISADNDIPLKIGPKEVRYDVWKDPCYNSFGEIN